MTPLLNPSLLRSTTISLSSPTPSAKRKLLVHSSYSFPFTKSLSQPESCSCFSNIQTAIPKLNPSLQPSPISTNKMPIRWTPEIDQIVSRRSFCCTHRIQTFSPLRSRSYYPSLLKGKTLSISRLKPSTASSQNPRNISSQRRRQANLRSLAYVSPILSPTLIHIVSVI